MSGRPAGEIRQAMWGAALQLHAERGSFTHAQLAERALVGYDVARVTCKNMAAAGELVRVGRDKPAGARVWMTLFEPADPAAQAGTQCGADLAAVVRAWAEFV